MRNEEVIKKAIREVFIQSHGSEMGKTMRAGAMQDIRDNAASEDEIDVMTEMAWKSWESISHTMPMMHMMMDMIVPMITTAVGVAYKIGKEDGIKESITLPED